MRYDLETIVRKKIDPNSHRMPQPLLGKDRVKRDKHQDRNYLVREFSLNRLIARAKKAETYLDYDTHQGEPYRVSFVSGFFHSGH
jgi:hypothetical protein